MAQNSGSPSLAAVLIVKDEVQLITRCVESLRPFVDEVIVYDTGSTDGTQKMASELGISLFQGVWNSSFAEARNAALAHCEADWVLSIDADEVASGDPGALRSFLVSSDAEVLKVPMFLEQDAAGYDLEMARLFRRSSVRWEGRVHEQLVGIDHGALVAPIASSLLQLRHSGYADEPARRQRAQRNIELALVELKTTSDTVAAVRARLDLGRSYVTLGEAQNAADAFESVRSNAPGTSEWKEATDFLVRLLLAEDMPDAALALTGQLSEVGISSEYCDWLAAQALVELRRYSEASELLSNVHQVTDSAGRQHNTDGLKELKHLVKRLAELNP